MIANRTIGLWIARWFGCGLFPYGPGTMGALGALPVQWLCMRLPWGAHVLIVVLVSVIGIWASDCAVKALGTDDPQQVVIDEVAGVLIAMAFVRGHSPWALVAAFVAFRVLDIWKPGPIDRIQRVRPEALAIMADDILAGLGAGALALLVP
jgi:phosphatidylglycerophosphatase A